MVFLSDMADPGPFAIRADRTEETGVQNFFLQKIPPLGGTDPIPVFPIDPFQNPFIITLCPAAAFAAARNKMRTRRAQHIAAANQNAILRLQPMTNLFHRSGKKL